MSQRILHINSYSSGGAYVFTKLLHDSLLQKDFDSRILTRFYRNRQKQVFRYSIIGNISFTRFVKKIFFRERLKRAQQYEIFTIPLKKSSISGSKYFKDSEIIHLHWVSDFLSICELTEMTKKQKIFWTLHDMNPFTGGCHHSDNCEQYLAGCENCPQLGNDGQKVKEYFNIKKNSFDKIDRTALTVVSPSRWMLEKASSSVLLKKFRHIYIPHFVDTEIFKYTDKDSIRNHLGLPRNKTIFLYVSAILDNDRKGFSKVIELSKKYENRNDLMFVFIGNAGNILKFDSKNIKLLGNINDSDLLAKYYSASDFLLNLTAAESFGFTTVESLCCGTPVICYDIPVMNEHIKDGINGIFTDLSVNDFIGRIDLFNKSGKSRFEISADAVQKYGSVNFHRYVELYKK